VLHFESFDYKHNLCYNLNNKFEFGGGIIMDSIVSAILGAVCIIIGLSHRKGNISMLHYYHRKRVSEEDKLPFGKTVGLGIIVIGVSLILASGLSFIAAALNDDIYLTIKNIALILGLSVGLGISFYAMIKYNKGIF